MATRSGSVDPGLALWLLDGRLSAAEVARGLDHESGLAGLSENDGDMRIVLNRRRNGGEAAALAFDVYTHRLRHSIAGTNATSSTRTRATERSARERGRETIVSVLQRVITDDAAGTIDAVQRLFDRNPGAPHPRDEPPARAGRDFRP